MTSTPQTTEKEARIRIGELATLAGVTTRTLRYWEELGIVKPTDHRCSGERLYSSAEVERVTHIRELQELLGLTLAEIRMVLESEDAVERARKARSAGASATRILALLENAIEAHSRLIERMDDRLIRIAAFRDESVDLRNRMRDRSVKLRREGSIAN